MGQKYTTNPVSGFNNSPPADDGSVSAANQVKWSTIKPKLADPLNAAIVAIDAGLVTAFDYSAGSISTGYTTLAGDHMKTIEIAPTVSSVVTVSLGDAATMAAGYTVNIVNRSNFAATITRATGSDTINGVAATELLASLAAVTYKVNSGANGYVSVGVSPPYSEGPWTPTLVFTTPGDLNVAYSVRVGSFIKNGNKTTITFAIVTSAFTHTTASGALAITGIPFATKTLTGIQFVGSLAWSGFTKAGYTQIVMQIGSNSSAIAFSGSGSGQAGLTVDTTWTPSGGTIVLNGTLTYFT